MQQMQEAGRAMQERNQEDRAGEERKSMPFADASGSSNQYGQSKAQPYNDAFSKTDTAALQAMVNNQKSNPITPEMQ